MKRHDPKVNLQPMPYPPPLPTAAQVTATFGVLSHQEREHRARALELAVVVSRDLDGGALWALADRYLAYINGTHQP